MSKVIYKKQKPTGVRQTAEEFIKKARKVHGSKYDYSEVVYKNSITKVTIICPEHGEFLQTPACHISGQGCSVCAGNIRSSPEEFVMKANKIHNNRYDYSKVIYKGAHCKVVIICPIHGEFEQKPNAHLNGYGCLLCGRSKSSAKRTRKNKDFITKAITVHGNRYDYSKVDYKHGRTKVIIICPIHGEFEQKPNSHIAGQGCPECGKISTIQKLTTTTEEFIEKARTIHGNKYNYSKVDYKNNHTKVTIICPIHGEFQQTPNGHLRGGGCSRCGSMGPDRSTDPHPGFLYFITCKLGNDYFCKIGTAYDTKRRFQRFPFEIIDYILIPGIIGPLSVVEEKIKKDFEKFRYVPKTKFAGYTECFRISAHVHIEKSVKKFLELP